MVWPVVSNRKKITRVVAWTFIACLNLFIIYNRVRDGIPMGEDSSSHLYKILYAYKNYKENGSIPAWSDLWYGGHPFLLFYPPLSYWLVLGLALLGLNPVAAYKLLDALFYIAAPIAVYFLAKEANLGENERLATSLLYALTPIVMENYLLFDRFPTTVSIPIFCAFLIYLSRALREEKIGNISVLTTLSAAIVLVHHLSAYCAILIAATFILSHFLHRRNAKRIAKIASFTSVGCVLLSSFWLIPFLSSTKYQEANPFVNFNLLYNYTELMRFGYVVFLLGAIQFFSAILQIRRIFFSQPKKHFRNIGRKLVILFTFGALSGTYGTLSENMFFTFTGQICVATSLGALLVILISTKKEGNERGNYFTQATAIWFVVFLWLGLGQHALLIQALPFWKKLDSMRFLLYASIPQAILASQYLTKLIQKGTAIPRTSTPKSKSRELTVFLICAAALTSTVLGGFSANLNNMTPNTNIPPEIIEYFYESPVNARILPIACPKWIHILPTYAWKPIIDGWFPQSKILKPLLPIKDYRINDLMEYSPEERNRIWQGLISDHTRLGINWVMIGDEDLRFLVEGNPEFRLVFTIDSIAVYEATDPVYLFEACPQNAISNMTITQPRPDEIYISIKNIEETTKLTIKQAYMPYWEDASNSGISVEEDEDGYILLLIPPTTNKEVKIRFSYMKETTLYLISAATMLVISLLIIKDFRKKRKEKAQP